MYRFVRVARSTDNALVDPLSVAMLLVGITATVILVARACEPFGLPTPLALLAVGAIGSLLPGIPEISMSPELVLFGLLPPLLYAAAIGTSLIDIRANTAGILGLSVGLVLFTALGVALVARLLIPDLPFAVAFALGAIVAPPDAVAATAVARRIGLPRRITTILEGESLLNDATALVSLRTALAAAGLAAHGAEVEEVTFGGVAGDFVWAVVGGVGIGVAAFFLIGVVRRFIHDNAADTALSFAAPYIAFVPAESLHASGVLAVVTTGLLLAHKAPVLQSASSRLAERVNWTTVTFVLENAVFLLIGLQLYYIVESVEEADDFTLGRTLLLGLAVLATVLVLRPLWMVPFAWLRTRVGRDHPPSRVRESLVGSWAGMRGVVTLAAAFTLPEETPHRDVLVMIALVVTVGTLLLQGLTLPRVAAALGVEGPDPRQDALVEASVVGAITGAGLRSIEEDPASDPIVLEELKHQATTRVNRIWERLGTLGESEDETPAEASARMRIQMIDAERAELLRIRSEGQVDQEVLAGVLRQLDAEESAISYGADKTARIQRSPLLTPAAVAGGCEHLQAEPACPVPRTPEGCEECLAEGLTWVHLRVCTHCGHVGCCDSSQGQHASGHHRETGHPVMRSLEPGEAWRWCFVDDVFG